MEILLQFIKILYFSIFFSTLSPLVKYGISKHTNTIMLELGSLPDMDQMLPNEESPSLSDYSEPLVAKKTTLENFPNPFMNPIECNRVNVQESYVCDPDKILNNSEADRLDELLSLERLNSTHHCEGFGDVPYKIGVALINHIPREDLNTLADELLDRWKLSHQKCEDGIIIVYTKQEPDVVIKWNKGVEPYLSTKVVSSIYPMCQNLLQNEKLAIAVEKCTSFVTKRVTGEILPPKETPQMLVTLVIASVVGLGFLAIVVSGILIIISRSTLALSGM